LEAVICFRNVVSGYPGHGYNLDGWIQFCLGFIETSKLEMGVGAARSHVTNLRNTLFKKSFLVIFKSTLNKLSDLSDDALLA
jgi:hypothetical protein